MKKILKPFEGAIYKRGEIVIINGIKHKYSKMVKGKQIFKKLEDESSK